MFLFLCINHNAIFTKNSRSRISFLIKTSTLDVLLFCIRYTQQNNCIQTKGGSGFWYFMFLLLSSTLLQFHRNHAHTKAMKSLIKTSYNLFFLDKCVCIVCKIDIKLRKKKQEQNPLPQQAHKQTRQI